MDGDFPGTIEKLCLELPDVEKFRPIHQLDFATSGVLLIGMSKAAAARARKGFESGRVKKCYLAILEVEASSFLGVGSALAPSMEPGMTLCCPPSPRIR